MSGAFMQVLNWFQCYVSLAPVEIKPLREMEIVKCKTHNYNARKALINR